MAAFYKALRDAGMSSEQAYELTKDHMSNLSLGGMLKNIVGGATKDHDRGSGCPGHRSKRKMARR